MQDDTNPNPGTAVPGPGPQFLLDLPHGLLLKRGTAWDARAFPALPAEREALGADRSERYGDYAAWRRGLIFVGLLAGLIAIAFEVYSLFVGIRDANELPQGGDIVILMVLVVFASRAWLVWALYTSLRRWTDLEKTGSALRRGWFVALVAPVVVSLVPLVLILSQGAAGGGAARAAQRDLVGLVFSMVMFWQAVPCVLSLFPGMMRAGLAVKCLLPGRGFGPAVGIAVAPVSALFLLTILIPIQQMVSSMVFLFGVVLVAAGPILYIRGAIPLLAPQSEADAREGVRRVRFTMWMIMVPALLLLAVPVMTKEFLGRDLVGFSPDDALFTVWNGLGLLAWFFTMISTYTLVCADGQIATMRRLEEGAMENADRAAWRADGEAVLELASGVGPGFLSRLDRRAEKGGEAGESA